MQAIGEDGVQEIITDIRDLADSTTSTTVNPVFSDDKIRRMVQRASNELYYMLIQLGVPYSTTKLTFTGITTPADSNDNAFYQLPTDFYKVLVLLYKDSDASGDFLLVPEGKIKDAFAGYKTASSILSFDIGDRTYLVISRDTGDELTIIPQTALTGSEVYLLEYIPDSPDVALLRVPQGWRDFIVYSGAAELGSADYNLIPMWQQKSAMLKSEIEGWALNRSPNSSQFINRTQTGDLTIEQINNQSIIFSDDSTLIP